MIHWLLGMSALAGQLAVYGDVVHPVAGAPIDDGVVVVEDGLIVAVGPAAQTTVPEGATEVRGAVVTPGLIDGLTVAGLSGLHNRRGDQDHREWGAVHPDLRAMDAYNGRDELVGWLRDHGVTTLHVGPSPGAAINGRSMVTKSTYGHVDEVALDADGAVILTLGEAAKSGGPSTRMGTAALIRQAFAGAREYAQRRSLPLADRPTIDLGKEALVDALEGRRRVIAHAHRADDLRTALRIADEFGLDLVLAGGTEAYTIRQDIADAEIPVLLGPVMQRSGEPGELRNATFESAALLRQAGVEVGIMAGFESYVPKVRVVLWEAAIAAANGLGAEAALEALTLTNARILGVADRVGSLEPGKQADLAVFDGDPFEYTSHVCAVVIDGSVVSETCH